MQKEEECEHRLMDYNNLPITQFKDVKKVLKQAMRRLLPD